MSLQQKLDNVEAEIEKIRSDPKYLTLKNRNRSQFDKDRFTKYTRRLKSLNVQRQELEKALQSDKSKSSPSERAGVTYVKRKPAWRNQRETVARNNQDRNVARNWVRDPDTGPDTSNVHPAIANASKNPEEEISQETMNMNRSHGPGTAFVDTFLLGKGDYEKRMSRKPVNRTPRELKEMEKAAALKAAKGAKMPKGQSRVRASTVPVSQIVAVDVAQPGRLPGMSAQSVAIVAEAETVGPEPVGVTENSRAEETPEEHSGAESGEDSAENSGAEENSGEEEGSVEEDSQEEFTDEAMFHDSFNESDGAE